MDDNLFSLVDDLPDELEAVVTSGDQIYNDTGDTQSTVSLLEHSDCPQCCLLRQELKKARSDHIVNYKMLKEKIIQTDLLIKRYNAKCQECDNKAKMVDSVARKLEEVKRDCDTMAANLKTALEEGVPLRKAREKLEKQKEDLKRQMTELEDKVQALEATNQQLQSAQESSSSKQERQATKARVKELEISLKKSEAELKKSQDKLEKKNSKIEEYQRKLQKQNNEKKKLENKISKYEDVLVKHGLQHFINSRAAVEEMFAPSPTLTDSLPDPPDSPMSGITLEQIFHEMGVFDGDEPISCLSPAVSPIPPSPAPAQAIETGGEDLSQTSDENSDTSESDIESLADLLQDKLMSANSDEGICQGSSKLQMLQSQLSMDDSSDDDDDDGDDISDIPFSHFETQDDGLVNVVADNVADSNDRVTEGRDINEGDGEVSKEEDVMLQGTPGSQEMVCQMENRSENLEKTASKTAQQNHSVAAGATVSEEKSQTSDERNPLPAETSPKCRLDGKVNKLDSHGLEEAPCEIKEDDHLIAKESCLEHVDDHKRETATSIEGSYNEHQPKNNPPSSSISRRQMTARTRRMSWSASSTRPTLTLRSSPRIKRCSESDATAKGRLPSDADDSSLISDRKIGGTNTDMLPTKSIYQVKSGLTKCSSGRITQQSVVTRESNRFLSDCSSPQSDTKFCSAPSEKEDQVSAAVCPGGHVSVVHSSQKDNTQSNELLEKSSSSQKPELPTDDKNSPDMITDDNKSSVMITDDKTSHDIVSDDKHSPILVTKDTNIPVIITKDKNSPVMVTDDKTLHDTVSVDKHLPDMITDDNKSSVMATDDKNSPVLVTDDKTLHDTVSDDKHLPDMITDDNKSSVMVTDAKNSPVLVTKDTNSPVMVTDDKTSYDTISDDKNSPDMITDDNKSSVMITDDKTSNDTVSDDTNSSVLVTDDRNSPVTVNVDKNSPVVITNDKTSLVMVTDDKHSPVVVSDGNISNSGMLASELPPSSGVENRTGSEGSDRHKVIGESLANGNTESSQKGAHPLLPKQSSTGFEVLSSEDLFSDSSAPCSPNVDNLLLSHGRTKERRPWSFPTPDTVESPKPRSPVRFIVGDSSLVPSDLLPIINCDVDDVDTTELVSPKRLPDIKEDDNESVSSLSLSFVGDLPSPVSPLSDFDGSSEVVVNSKTVDAAKEKEFKEKNNNVTLTVHHSQTGFTSNEFSDSCGTSTKTAMETNVTTHTEGECSHGNPDQVGDNLDIVSDTRVLSKTRISKRKISCEHPVSTTCSQVPSLSSSKSATETPAEAEVPAKKQKNSKTCRKNNTKTRIDQMPTITLTKQHRKIIEHEVSRLAAHASITTQLVVDQLQSAGVTLKGVTEVIIQHTILSSYDVISAWHKNCLSESFSAKTPWLLEPEKRLIELIKHIDSLETGVTSYFMTRVQQVLFSMMQAPAPSFPALCRMYVALCRAAGQLDRCRVFAYDVVYLKLNLYSALITAIAGVWPEVLYKHETDVSPILRVLEYVIMVKTLHSEKPRHKMMSCILHKLCNWEKTSSGRDALASQLLNQLSSGDSSKQGERFECARALDLLACHEDWAWTNDVLICSHLWPILQRWGSQKADRTMDGLVQSVLSLVGYLMSHCPADKADITKPMMNMFKALLQQKQSEQVSPDIQVIAMHSLIRLSPYDPESSTSCLEAWLKDSDMAKILTKEDSSLIESCIKHYRH